MFSTTGARQKKGDVVTVTDIVVARPISEIWVAIGGDPPRHGRARAFYRRGDNPQAVSINDAKGTWFDYRDNVGGGVLALIQRTLACDRVHALRWLSNLVGLPLDNRKFTPAERRVYRERMAQADRLAHEVADFERGLELCLLCRLSTGALLTEWMLQHEADPTELLFNARKDLVLLEKTDPDSLVQFYRKLSEPVRRHFSEAGRGDREHAEAITWAIVEMLARVEPQHHEGVCA